MNDGGPSRENIPFLWDEIRRTEARFEKSIEELKDQIEAHHTANVGRLTSIENQLNQGLGFMAATRYAFHFLWGIGGALVGYMFNRLTSK